MSHFLDRLTFFKRDAEAFANGHGITTTEDRSLGGRLPQALAARQGRALHAWRQLHRLLLLEDLRQGRHRHLGNPADGLSAHAARPAQPRAARLLPRGELQLVSLFGQPREISAGALAPAEAVARGADAAGAGGGLGIHRREPGEAGQLHQGARPRRLRARHLGRGDGDHRRRQCLHGEDLRAGPHLRLLADPGHVDGLLCGGLALPVAASAACACRSTTGTATCRRPLRRPGASRPTFRNRPTGTMPASSSCGARTFRRPARRMRISTPRRAIAA